MYLILQLHGECGTMMLVTGTWEATPPCEVWQLFSLVVASRSHTDHINLRILHSGSGAMTRWIPETMVCRILASMWSFGSFILAGRPVELTWHEEHRHANPASQKPSYCLAQGCCRACLQGCL